MSIQENDLKGDRSTESIWRVKEPNEAKYNFSDEEGVWQPRPEDILSLFEKLAQGKPLQLKWTCPGRRPPEKNVKSEKSAEDRMETDCSDSKEETSKPLETSAFDFDEPHIDVNAKLIPKRAPGGLGRTPKTEKRVARMDNIMKSLHKQQVQRAAEREARRAKGSPSGTPPNRPRLLNFGPKQSSPGVSAVSGSSSGATLHSRFTGGSAATSHSRFTGGSGATSHSRFTGGSAATSHSRFTGGSAALNSSPLFSRAPTAAALVATPRKLSPKASTSPYIGATDPGSKSDTSSVHAGSVASVHMAPVGTSENKSELTGTGADLPETGATADESPAGSVQPGSISSTVSSACLTSLTNSVAKMSTSFMSSVTGGSSNAVPSLFSNPAAISMDKEFASAAETGSADSSLPFVSISSRMPVSTATPTANSPAVSVTASGGAQSASSAAVPAANSSNASPAVSELNHEGMTADTAVHDPPSVAGEPVPPSTGSVDLNI